MAICTIITPAYNEEALIGQAIASVLAQTFTDWHWLIVDDGSTDRTAEIIENTNDPRIQLLRSGAQAGAAAARNLAIARADSEYIALLDADDTWQPDKLAKQFAYLTVNNLPACITQYAMKTLQGHRRAYALPDLRQHGWQKRLLRKCDLSIGSTLLIKRECFAICGTFNSSLQRLEDWEWLWRFLAKYNLGCVQEVLVSLEQSIFPSAARLLPAIENVKPLLQAHAAQKFGAAGRQKITAAMQYERAALARHQRDKMGIAKALLACGLISPSVLWQNSWERLRQPA